MCVCVETSGDDVVSKIIGGNTKHARRNEWHSRGRRRLWTLIAAGLSSRINGASGSNECRQHGPSAGDDSEWCTQCSRQGHDGTPSVPENEPAAPCCDGRSVTPTELTASLRCSRERGHSPDEPGTPQHGPGPWTKYAERWQPTEFTPAESPAASFCRASTEHAVASRCGGLAPTERAAARRSPTGGAQPEPKR